MQPYSRALRVYYIYRLTLPFFYALWLTVSMLYHFKMVTSDPLQLVMIGVVLESATLFFEIPTGVIADYYSRKLSIVMGLLLWGMGFLIEGLFPVYGMILVSQFVWGMGFTCVSGAIEAWLVDEIGQEAATSALVRGTQIGLGSSLAGTITAALIGTIAINLPIVIGGAGILSVALFLAVRMPETGFSPEPRADSAGVLAVFDTFREGLREVRGHAVLRSVILIGVVTGLSAGGFDHLYTPHIVQNFTMPFFEDVVWFGIINAGVMLFTIVALEIVHRYIKHMERPSFANSLAILAIGTVLGNLVFVWSGVFWVALVAYWFSQTLRTVTKPLFMAWINGHTTSKVRATVISMYWQSSALGGIAGAPFIGLIGSFAGLRMALMITSLALSPVIGLYRQHRDQPQQFTSLG